MSRGRKWAIKKEGLSRASKIYPNKEDAVKRAVELSKGVDVIVVHKVDGAVERMIQ